MTSYEKLLSKGLTAEERRREGYPIEDIRQFFIEQQLVHDKHLFQQYPLTISRQEFHKLKRRTLQLDPHRTLYLKAFIDGWRASR